jgi:predicted MPP superfamily phosphohydrolase
VQKIGVYAVLGNHDIGATEMQRLVDALGSVKTVLLLRNKWVEFDIPTRNGPRSLKIIGIESPDDWWNKGADDTAMSVISQAMSASSADYSLVASHQPDIFDFVFSTTSILLSKVTPTAGNWPFRTPADY